MSLEYPLQTLNSHERQTSVYAGFEDEPNALHSFKDSFLTLFDLLKLTLNYSHWILLFAALFAFVLAGGFFTYNFAVLKELVEVLNIRLHGNCLKCPSFFSNLENWTETNYWMVSWIKLLSLHPLELPYLYCIY